MVTGDHPITVQAILILDSDPEWEMAKSTDEHQKRLHFTKEKWAMSVEGRRQRQNVEKVKLDVMPSPGQSPKRTSDENEFELKEEVEESFFEINPDPFYHPSDNNEDRENKLDSESKV